MRVRRTEKDYKCFGRVLGSMLGWGGERTRVHTWWTVMLVGSKWKYRVDEQIIEPGVPRRAQGWGKVGAATLAWIHDFPRPLNQP